MSKQKLTWASWVWALPAAAVGVLAWQILVGKNVRLITVSALFLCPFAFALAEKLDTKWQRKEPATRKQHLFHSSVAFEQQRFILLAFLLTFILFWSAVAAWPEHLQKATYDLVFLPVAVAGGWWFFRLWRNTERNYGWAKARLLLLPLFGLWILANFVDVVLIKLGAWTFSRETTLWVWELDFLGPDALGKPVIMPIMEIFGFNLCISWFILFVQNFLNDLIVDPRRIRKLFPRLKDKQAESVAPVVRAVDPRLAVCRAVDENTTVLEEALDNLFRELDKGYAPEEDHILEMLGALRKKRLFAQLERVCEALLKHDLTYPAVFRQMAQAHIDQGHPHSAPFYLDNNTFEMSGTPEEWKEAKGLLGRTYKQTYVNMVGIGLNNGKAGEKAGEGQTETSGKNAGRAERYLLSALEHYRAVYQSDAGSCWHGINFVACTARGHRDGLKDRAFKVDWKPTATDILNLLTPKAKMPGADPWDIATCVEACVALGDVSEAENWADLYVESGSPKADVFEYTSTYRQFREVWQLEEDKRYAKVMDMLKRAVLKKPAGKVYIQEKDLETRPDGLLIEGLENCARVVARVERADGALAGTGFVASAPDIYKHWKSGLVFITAEHVIRGEKSLWLQFLAEKRKCKLGSILWSSSELDVAIFSLDKTMKFLPPSLSTAAEYVGTGFQSNQSPIYVMGYPQGRQLQITCSHNHFVGCTSTYIRYKTQTWPGSSGSPVLDQDWQVVGIHTEATAGEDASQGVHLAAVRRAVSRELRPFFKGSGREKEASES